MVRYAHFRGIMKGGPVLVNENGSGCLVEIKGVTLHFGAKMIFNDLSLEIRRLALFGTAANRPQCPALQHAIARKKPHRAHRGGVHPVADK
jgi:hypothetical protein